MRVLQEVVQPGVVITLGAGDIFKVGERLLETMGEVFPMKRAKRRRVNRRVSKGQVTTERDHPGVVFVPSFMALLVGSGFGIYEFMTI